MIRVQNLVKRFGELTAVDDVSFEVHRGEVFAFLGPNGAGKTTTIKMLTTLLRPTSGVVELDGLDPAVERDKVRQRFGVVFQDPSLDQDLTAWENMEIHGVLYGVPRQKRRERAETLLKMFELWERRDALVKTFSKTRGTESTKVGWNAARSSNRFLVSETWPIVLLMSLIADTVSLVAICMSAICAPISPVAFAV